MLKIIGPLIPGFSANRTLASENNVIDRIGSNSEIRAKKCSDGKNRKIAKFKF